MPVLGRDEGYGWNGGRRDRLGVGVCRILRGKWELLDGLLLSNGGLFAASMSVVSRSKTQDIHEPESHVRHNQRSCRLIYLRVLLHGEQRYSDDLTLD